MHVQPRLVSKEPAPADKRDASSPTPIVRPVDKYGWADSKKTVT
jgi:hypothetical protein